MGSLHVTLGDGPGIHVDFGNATPSDIEEAIGIERTRALAAEAALRSALAAAASPPNLHASVTLDDLAPALRAIVSKIPADWNVDHLTINIYDQEGNQRDLNLEPSLADVTEATGGIVKSVSDSPNRITFQTLNAQGAPSMIVAEKAAGGAGNSAATPTTKSRTLPGPCGARTRISATTSRPRPGSSSAAASRPPTSPTTRQWTP